MCLRQASVASLSEFEGTHSLRNCPFDSQAGSIPVLEVGRILFSSCALESLMLRLRSQLHHSSLLFTTRTEVAGGTGVTDLDRKCDMNNGIAGAILDVLMPTGRDFALGTGYPFRLPVNLELGNIIASLLSSLPRNIWEFCHRSDEFNATLLCGFSQQIGRNISCIDQCSFGVRPFCVRWV